MPTYAELQARVAKRMRIAYLLPGAQGRIIPATTKHGYVWAYND